MCVHIFLQTVHKLAIRSDVRFRFATTEVECVMSNDKSSPHELMFDFTLPKGAFITNFSMWVFSFRFREGLRRGETFYTGSVIGLGLGTRLG